MTNDDPRAISQAVRHLEDLKAAGYLSQDEFLAEMQALVQGVEDDSQNAPPEPEPRTPLQGKSPLPGQDPAVASHGPPGRLTSTKPAQAEPAPEANVSDPEDAPGQPTSELASGKRVIIKGTVPWEQDEDAPVRMESLARTQDKNPMGEDPDHAPIIRSHLAQMASRDVAKLNRKRNPNAAALMSLLIPGLGQFYLNQPAQGLGFMATAMCLAGYMIVAMDLNGFFILGPTALLSAALAQRSALFHNYCLERKRVSIERAEKMKEKNLDLERSVRRADAQTSQSSSADTGRNDAFRRS